MINARSSNSQYQGLIEAQPYINFDKLQQSIMDKHFKVIDISSSTLIIEIGFMKLELKNN